MKILLHNDPVLGKAHEQYEKFTQDDELRELYEAREKWQRDNISRIKSAERKAEARGEKNVALNMLKEGFSIPQVIKVTHFSKEELMSFQEEILKEKNG